MATDHEGGSERGAGADRLMAATVLAPEGKEHTRSTRKGGPRIAYFLAASPIAAIVASVRWIKVGLGAHTATWSPPSREGGIG